MSWIITNRYDMLNTCVLMYGDKPKEKWLVKKDELPELLECIAGETFEKAIGSMETYFGANLFSVYLDAAEEWRRTKREPPLEIKGKNTEYIWADLDTDQPEQILVLRKKEYMKFFKEELERWSNRQLGPTLTDTLNTIQEKGLKEWVLGITNNFPNVPSHLLGTFGRPIKPGKFLRKFNVNDTLGKDILSLMGEYLAVELRKNRIEQPEIKISDMPSEIYILDGLNQSCMRNMSQDTFELYDDISSCKIAYMLQEEKLVGRALLWEEVEVYKEYGSIIIKLMDRIYYNNDGIRDAFIVWAEEHGYWVKTEQSLGCYKFRDPDTNEIHHMSTMHVNVDFTFEEGMYKAAPYLDTFPRLRIGDDKICSYWDNSVKGKPVNLQSAEGAGGVLTGTYTCTLCGHVTDDDIEHEGQHYCQDCYHEEFIECEDCGCIYSRDEIYYVWLDGEEQYLCNRCLNRYNQSRRNPEHWWSNDRCIDAYDEGRRNVTLTPDDLEDYEECAICGELHHYTNVKEDKYGDTYCEFCYENDVKPEDKD